jgi:asparagine synthase (glutamine-hydrolysing)
MTLRVAFDGRAKAYEPHGRLREIARLGDVQLLSDAPIEFSKTEDMVLLGWAFRRSDNRACTELREDEQREIVVHGASWATRHLWGNYILAWTQPSGAVRIFRSPVSGPALYFEQGSQCAFSHLDLGKALGLDLDRLDPGAIEAQLRFPFLRGPSTGIAEVYELLPGETLEMGNPMVTRPVWSPWSYALCPPVEATLDELRRHVMSVVGAWSTRFGRVQLELSGGLDSSIVAASLARTRAQWRAVTLVTRRPDGDECGPACKRDPVSGVIGV